jgi:hypothetical protein
MREPLDLDACRGYVAEISQAKKYANDGAPSISNRSHSKAKAQIAQRTPG